MGGFVLAACAEGGSDPTAEIAFDTLPNGALHVQNPETGTWREGQEWRLVEELRIGAMEGVGPDVFGEVTAVVIGDDGTLYVLDGQALELRVFGPEGAHIAIAGGKGGGPGELRFPTGLALQGEDRLWLLDPGNVKYAIVSSGGEHLEDRPREGEGIVAPWPGRFTSGEFIEG